VVVIDARIDDRDRLPLAGDLRELLDSQILTDQLGLSTPGGRKHLAAFKVLDERMVALRH
jgi:hypothetical protein